MQDSVPDRLGALLEEAIRDYQVFCVVDAAQFEYLQDTLTTERFHFDPLYLDEIDNASIASGPHLIHLTGLRQLKRLRAVLGEEQAGVWWVWPDEPGAGNAIHRHLRGLNMVEIPKDRFDTTESEPGFGFERVLFRHADPNVIVDVLYVLEPEQQRRLFGAAVALIVDAPDSGGVRKLLCEPSEGVSRGMLRISAEQYPEIGVYSRAHFEERIVEYLARAAPEKSAATPQAEIEALVPRQMQIARGYGLKSERAFARWCFLAFATDEQFLESAGIEDYLTADSPATPDQKIELLLKSCVAGQIAEAEEEGLSLDGGRA